ncbi:uncharacterized protein DS421_10g309560 [Arachis hypogaea]|nr:uncharacterized protein DS421_10g309560 [Arachis hypogaea]
MNTWLDFAGIPKPVNTRPVPTRSRRIITRPEARQVLFRASVRAGAYLRCTRLRSRQRDSVILTQSLLLLDFSTKNLTTLIVVTSSVVSLLSPSSLTFTALVVATAEPVIVVVEPVTTFLLNPFFSRLITWSSQQLCVSLLPESLSPERVAVFLLYLSIRR